MIRHSISEGCRLDHVKELLECGRGHENVTESMDSFRSKAVERGASKTPMDPPIMVAPSRPQLTMMVGVPPDPVDRVTLVPMRPTSGMALCPRTHTHQADNVELGGELELFERTQRWAIREPDVENLEIAITESNEEDNIYEDTEGVDDVDHKPRVGGQCDHMRDEVYALTISGPSKIYARYRKPELTRRARGRLVIELDDGLR